MRAIAFATIALLLARPALAGDGVLEINQACAVTGGCFPGDTAGFPVTITTSGSYRLTSNLTMPDTFTSAIRIQSTSNVSIDLGGFAIVGQIVCSGTPISCLPSPASGNGVEINGTTQFNSVRNGSIRGMGDSGIALGPRSEVMNVRAIGNQSAGIDVGADSVVTGNVAAENGTSGAWVGGGSVVTNNVFALNGADGITDLSDVLRNNGILAAGNTLYQNGFDGLVVGDGSTVNANTIVSNGQYGLSNVAGEVVAYTDNFLRSNTTADVEPSSGLRNLGGNSCNGTTTCP